MTALFPELAARRVEAGVVGGPECVKRFAAAFGLPGKLRSVRVGLEGEVECEASMDGTSVLTFGLVPADRKAWLRAEGFGVVLTRTSAVPPTQFAAALARFVKRYGHVPLEEFARRVEPEGGDAHTLPWDDTSTLFYSYGAGKAWRTFTESGELHRAVCEEIHGPDVVAVKHEEHECAFTKVYGDSGSVGFFNTVEAQPRNYQRTSDEGMVTDIEDLDVIKGGDAKLLEVLESVQHLPRKPRLVVVHSSCVPSVTGDDLGAAASKAEAKIGVPVMVLGQESNPQDILLRRLVDDPVVRGRGVRRARVNLLGYPVLTTRSDLLELLRACGVEIGCMVFPDLDPTALAGFGEAEVNVAYPWERYAGPISGVAEKFPDTRLLTPPPPFGFEGTRRWLFAVADAVGRGDAARSLWAAEEQRGGDAWRRGRERASRYRLGFISDRRDWRSQLSEVRMMGVPLVDVALDLGFAGVDVLAFSATGAPEEPTRPEVRVVPFDSRVQLRDAISASPAAAFYSEMYFDRRLTRLGKGVFSLRDVGYGLRGAEQTLERLLVRCRTPFYRLYGHLCGPAFTDVPGTGGGDA